MTTAQPYRIHFQQLGSAPEGFLTVAATQANGPWPGVPFEVRRVFWTHNTPPDVTRGRHAHHATEMVLLALRGSVVLSTEMPDGTRNEFVLDRPDEGIYLPPLCWHEMRYSADALQLVLTSTDYDPADYIRDYNVFKKLND
jgi:dTDP-4-dehydrorhamnose 3,5-epimerase-like enzyme